jgi:hypothetical protein
LRDTPTVLQLADRSTVKLKGMLEDIIISIDSWEYPTDFLVLQTKSQFNGYPLILGRPWLATSDAYIDCREDNMTITDGLSQKQIVLYPPTQPLIKENLPMWVEEEEDLVQTTSYPIYTINTTLASSKIDEDTFLVNFLQNQYPTDVKIEGINDETIYEISADNKT